MAKITVNGEVFDWDPAYKPMSEALALEDALKCRYADWETDLAAGSAKAVRGLIWLVWRRNGRDVPLEDIGTKIEVDLGTITVEDTGGDADPTMPPPVGSPTTGSGTSPRSASSGSGRGKSGG
jgi:hypothetical protein